MADERRNRDKSSRNRNDASTRKQKPGKKTFQMDVLEQLVDSSVGPMMDQVVSLLPESMFTTEKSRRLMSMSTVLADIASVAIGQLTDAPPIVDNVRTRVVAAWSDRVKNRLRGTPAQPGTKMSREAAVALGPASEAMGNMISFMMLLNPDDWERFYVGMQELSIKDKRRLVGLFAAMKPNQVNNLAKRISGQHGKKHDWGLLFGIFEDMGILEGDSATSELASEDPKVAIAKILQLPPQAKATALSFIEFITQRSQSERLIALAVMASWNNNQFAQFAKLDSHEARAALLLGAKPENGGKRGLIPSITGSISEIVHAVQDIRERRMERNDALIERVANQSRKTWNSVLGIHEE